MSSTSDSQLQQPRLLLTPQEQFLDIRLTNDDVREANTRDDIVQHQRIQPFLRIGGYVNGRVDARG